MCVCRLFSNLTHTCTNATQGKVIARNTKKSFGIIYKKKLPIGRSAKHVSVLLRQPVLYIYKWLKPLSSLSTHHISFHGQTQLLLRTHQPFTAKGSICLICENYKRKQDNHVNIHEKLLTFYSSEAIDITPVDPTHFTEHLSISETKNEDFYWVSSSSTIYLRKKSANFKQQFEIQKYDSFKNFKKNWKRYLQSTLFEMHVVSDNHL